MKNFMKKIALLASILILFSCSKNTETELKPVSIVEIAKATPDYTNFVKALDLTGLTSTFDSAGDYTVFIPNDAAFDAVLQGTTIEDFNTANPGALAKILKYHVLSSRVYSSTLTNNQVVKTLLCQTFTISIVNPDPNPDPNYSYLNSNAVSLVFPDPSTPGSNLSAKIIARDVKCTNGVIHPVNAVLIPNLN